MTSEGEARIAAHLAELQVDPNSEERRDALRADVERHGLSALFRAAEHRLGAGPAAPPPAAAADPMRAGSIGLLDAIAEHLRPPGGLDGGRVRQTWADTIGSRTSQPLRIFRPETLEELRAIVRLAAAERCRVKAVGSGHSFTDVAVTRDFLIETDGLTRPLPLEREVLRAGVDAETLFEAEAGITVRALNEALWAAGLGLVNMGGYDGQTFAGVMSTSTHGSGLAFGPLSGQVESLTLVAGDGAAYRVEPTAGITDPDRWAARHPEVELKQDDDWFYASQVGLGCLGVIYSVVLRVRARYYLREERTLGVWSRLKQELQDGRVLRQGGHYELLVNPYQTNGDHTCLITRRDPVPEPTEPPGEWPRRNVLVELAASVPGSNSLVLGVFNSLPWLTPQIIDRAMQALIGEYVDRSYRVFNIGQANDVPAYGSEIGFPMSQYLAATDRILEITAQRQRLGQAYLTSPFSLRFVQAAKAYLSMMYGADTCMVELILLDGTVGGRELLQEIEREMYAFGGRPHWGLLNFLSGADGLIEAMYPMLPRWLELFRVLGHDGRFDNAFTERCGFSKRTFGRI
jgi:hypothetical protein